MIEHGRHKQPATLASFRSGIPVIRHRLCGGRIWKRYDSWECGGCDQKWKPATTSKWGDAEVECRFYLDGDKDPAAYVIVWTTEGKHRFSKLVPQSEAHLYDERFKL